VIKCQTLLSADSGIKQILRDGKIKGAEIKNNRLRGAESRKQRRRFAWEQTN